MKGIKSTISPTYGSFYIARQYYAKKNLFVGGGLLCFITGVYFYSIHVVSQEDFADVPILKPKSTN